MKNLNEQIKKGRKSMVQRINKYLFLVLLLVLGITFFTRNNFRNVSEVAPEAATQPVQEKVYDKAEIRFAKDGYRWQLTPLYDYEISGFVVGKMNYETFSINRYDSVFPVDLGMVWGSNVASKVYQDKRVTFIQDSRWCWVRWTGDVDFNLKELSNNHLLLENEDLENEAKRVNRGDQITIKGKLVNVKAVPLGKKGESGQEIVTWKSSTTREDDGAGACEVIYVEDIEVLKKGNVLSHSLFRFSLYGLILIVIWSIACFLYGIYSQPKTDF